MLLSDQDIKDFQCLYRKRFKKEISYEQAYESFSKLLNLLKVIYKPMSKDGYRKLEQRKKDLGLLDPEGEN